MVSIVALLLAVLMPSLSAARANARRTLCGCQLREIGRALDLYAEIHHDRYPTAEAPHGMSGPQNWWENAAFLEILGQRPKPQQRSVLTCPADGEPNRCTDGSLKDCWSSYAANASAFGMRRGRSKRGRRRSQIRFPVRAMAFCDAFSVPDSPHVVGWQGCICANFGFPHGGRSTVVYADTHVDWLRPADVPLKCESLWEKPFWGNIPVFDTPCDGA